MSGPWTVVSTTGNKAKLKNTVDGKEYQIEGHILCPPGSHDLEVPAFDNKAFEKDDEEPLSIGQICQAPEDQGQAVLRRRGQKFILRKGEHVAYTTTSRKICLIGRVIAIHEADQTVVVQRYHPEAGGLRVHWKPLFRKQSNVPEAPVKEDFDGTEPVKDTLTVKQLVTKADLNADGVLGAAAARRLDRSNYRLAEEVQTDPVLTMRENPPCHNLRGESIAAAYEELVRLVESTDLVRGDSGAGEPPPACLATQDSILKFSSTEMIQKSAQLGHCDYLEIFEGHGAFGSQLRKSGVTVGVGIDRKIASYGKSWELADPRDQERLAYLIVFCLRPLATHWGTPCKNVPNWKSRRRPSD